MVYIVCVRSSLGPPFLPLLSSIQNSRLVLIRSVVCVREMMPASNPSLPASLMPSQLWFDQGRDNTTTLQHTIKTNLVAYSEQIRGWCVCGSLPIFFAWGAGSFVGFVSIAHLELRRKHQQASRAKNAFFVFWFVVLCWFTRTWPR